MVTQEMLNIALVVMLGFITIACIVIVIGISSHDAPLGYGNGPVIGGVCGIVATICAETIIYMFLHGYL